MSSPHTQTPRHLGDFVEFLEWLNTQGIEFAVIGGQAVSAYADLLDQPVRSEDLDIYVSETTMHELLDRAMAEGLKIIKRPQPRHLPVAVFEAKGLEINALTETSGLLPPEIVVRTARSFVLSAHGDLEVPVADPFDLLSNKLSVARDKDRSHINILRTYVEYEVIEAFLEESNPRARLKPARRLLEVLSRKTLPKKLFDRLIDLATTPVDFRFLASCAPTENRASRLLDRTSDEALQAELKSIIASRSFNEP